MSIFKNIFLPLALIALLTVSCDNTDNGGGEAGFGTCYIVNYGSYGNTKGSLSNYDTEKNVFTNGSYEAANSVKITSNIQHAYEFGSNIYFMGNSADQVFFVDTKTLTQSKNGITKDIIKPRFCVGAGNYLYISCWGGNIWVDASVSYIAKYNTTTNEVEKKIMLAGGPEGMEIVNGKLYAALNYDNKVAIIDLASEAISYIETPGVNSYFLKDKKNNLYVSMVSTYSDPNPEEGLGYINTTTDELEATYELSGISSGYSSIMQFSPNQSKIYVVATDGGWPPVGAIRTFDVSTGKFLDNNFLSGKTGINGVDVNPVTGDVYCFIAENTTAAGLMSIFSAAGDSITTHSTGISPSRALFVK